MTCNNRIQCGLERLLNPSWNGMASWNIFITVFVTRVVVIIFASSFLWSIWKALKPENPAPDRARIEAAKLCATTIRDELRTRRDGYRTLVCIPFADDSTGVAFEATRDALASSGAFDVCPKSFGERLRTLLDARASGSDDVERAVRRARRLKADAALVGAVLRFETIDGRASLVVDYRLIDASSGKEVFSGTYDSTKIESQDAAAKDEPTLGSKEGADKFAETTLDAVQEATRNVWFGFALWILAVLAIPIVSFRMLEAATAKRSNRANAFALLSCFLADAAFAWVLVKPTFQGAKSIAGVVLMGVCAFWFDAQMLRLANRRTSSP